MDDPAADRILACYLPRPVSEYPPDIIERGREVVKKAMAETIQAMVFGLTNGEPRPDGKEPVALMGTPPLAAYRKD
jgi:hypothetical protein